MQNESLRRMTYNSMCFKRKMFRLQSHFTDDFQAFASCWNDDCDISRFSDHLTVWLDRYIGIPAENVIMTSTFQANFQPWCTFNYDEALFDECWLNCSIELREETQWNDLKDNVNC
ncbi:unnamed protein product [Didymodactylos carnosus]|uniref:Uncharacterized protein n=1 Tax=Didymodactylos carnosus TaxID=1234261 RepID=A0A814RS15_9BILA|nr:unnamed protein product [Didymodactylos carnosus]CAF3901472.1 unnamed protein product [Didymodactylos carnosus]